MNTPPTIARAILVPLLLYLLIGSCALTSPRSVWREETTLREAIDAADAVARAGRVDDAIAMLDVPGNASSARVQFTIGLFHTMIAENEPDTDLANASLRRAVRRWETALTLAPDHVPSMQNLAVAYVELGETERAMRFVKDAGKQLATDEETIYAIQMIKGDLFVRTGRTERAVQVFEEAVEKWPQYSEAAARLLALALHEADLMALCERFAENYPAVARDGYETLITNAALDEAANEHLGKWLELESELDALSRQSLARLMREEWEGSAFAELETLVLASNPGEFGQLTYWTAPDEPLRRHQLARAVQALGERHDLDQEPGRAADYFEYGLRQDIAPSHVEYADEGRLADAENARMDLLLDLLVTFHTHPEVIGNDPSRLLATIDDEWPSAAAFEADRELFSAKEVQKFHSTLGLILADRGAWYREDWHSAPLHLGRAAEIAEGRGEPRPDLWLVLAEGLEEDGVLLDAQDAYRAAAGNYLTLGERPGGRRVLRETASMTRGFARKADECLLKLEDTIFTPEGWYLGGMLGYARGSDSGRDFERELAALGFDADVDLDRDDIGGKLFAGYRFDRTWAVEFSALTLGDARSRVDGPGGMAFEDTVRDRHPLIGRGLGVAVLGRLLERRRLTAFGKVGYWAWEADVEIEGLDEDKTTFDGADFFYGLGLQYDFGQQIGLRAELERYELDDNDVDQISIGFTVDF